MTRLALPLLAVLSVASGALSGEPEKVLSEFRALWPAHLEQHFRKNRQYDHIEMIANAKNIGPNQYRCAYNWWNWIKTSKGKKTGIGYRYNQVLTLQALRSEVARMKQLKEPTGKKREGVEERKTLQPKRVKETKRRGDEEPCETNVDLELTFPAGKSPKVFTSGWLFGARCIKNPGNQDLSEQVRWSGTGRFTPQVGKRSRPSLKRVGPNRIRLEIKVDGKKYAREFAVVAVSPARYARVGDTVMCWGILGTSITESSGSITTGSPIVRINGLPAARLGDKGAYTSGVFTIKSGDPEVLIDGKPAARIGDKVEGTGGDGEIISGGPGDNALGKKIAVKGSGTVRSDQYEDVVVVVQDKLTGKSLAGALISGGKGRPLRAVGKTDATGRLAIREVLVGRYKLAASKQGYAGIETSFTVTDLPPNRYHVITFSLVPDKQQGTDPQARQPQPPAPDRGQSGNGEADREARIVAEYRTVYSAYLNAIYPNERVEIIEACTKDGSGRYVSVYKVYKTIRTGQRAGEEVLSVSHRTRNPMTVSELERQLTEMKRYLKKLR